MSEAALTVLAGGTLHVLDGHLRSGQLRPLRAPRWTSPPGARCTRPPSRGRCPAAAAPPLVATRAAPRRPHRCPAARPPRPAAGFVARHQRARILEAVLLVSAEQGFEAASVRELIAAAGLSHQAFYENFASKEDAGPPPSSRRSRALPRGLARRARRAHGADQGRRRRRRLPGLPGLRAAARPAAARRRADGGPRRAAGDRRGAGRLHAPGRPRRGDAQAAGACRPRWSAGSPSWPPAGCSTAAPPAAGADARAGRDRPRPALRLAGGARGRHRARATDPDTTSDDRRR